MQTMIAKIYEKKVAANHEDEDDEQPDNNYQTQLMEKIQVVTSHLFEKLLKSNTPSALQSVNCLIYDIFPTSLYKSRHTLISTLIEISDYSQLSNQWESFARVFLQYSNNSNSLIREDACRGIGFLIEKTPHYLMNQAVIKNWFDSLNAALNIMNINVNTKSYLHCQDIIYASMGRIIKAHSKYFDLKRYFEIWLGNLPLNHAKNEANTQIQFLVDTTTTHKELMLGNNEVANFKRLLTIYGNMVRRAGLCSQSVRAKIRVHINCLQFDALVSQSLKVAWNEITGGHRQSIVNLMA